MGELFNLWDNFFKELPKIRNALETTALKNGLDVNCALFLVALFCYPTSEILADQNIIDVLCNKGLCEYNEKDVVVTSKGAILAKSLTIALKKL